MGQQVANIVQAYEASNGFVYLIDEVLVTPEDVEHLQQTGTAPSSPMSSLLGGHNSALGELWQNFLANFSNSKQDPEQTNLLTTLIGTLSCAIILLALVIALVLVGKRRRRQQKLNGHQQLESGLASSSSGSNTGSTSTTKSL